MFHIVGLSGTGKSALDECVIEKKRISYPTHREIKAFSNFIRGAKTAHVDAFRKACIDVLGEDPEDWGLSMEGYEEKYKLPPM